MKYPIEKYRIVVHQHPTYHTTEIIAMSTYAGEVVKGKAICNIADTYNEEAGKELAIARCAAKIAKKRKARSARLLKHAKEQLAAAQKYVDDMSRYHKDSCQEYEDANADIENILIDM